jgi:hypothetical protein
MERKFCQPPYLEACQDPRSEFVPSHPFLRDKTRQSRKGSLKQEKDVLKTEKEVLKQERKFQNMKMKFQNMKMKF